MVRFTHAFTHSQGQHLPVGDAKIYFEITGNPAGEPLVLLHGGLGNITDFNGILDQFAKDYQLIGIDFRGHGKSTLGSLGLSYQRHQTDVEAVLAHLGIEACYLLGFSDGGTTSYRLAIKNPSKIKAMVTIGAKSQLSANDQTFAILSGMTAEKWEQRFPDSVAYYKTNNPEPGFEALVKAVVSLWTDTGSYPGSGIEDIAAPTLIIRGDRDHLFPLETAVHLAQHIKGANFFNIPFAGHEVHKDANTLFSSVVKDFFKNPVKL